MSPAKFGKVARVERPASAESQLLELREPIVQSVTVRRAQIDPPQILPVQYVRQRVAAACDPAFDCPQCTAQEQRGFDIGKAADADQNQGLALVVRQGIHRTGRVAKIDRRLLSPGRRRNRVRKFGSPGHLPPSPALMGIEFVAQDRAQPGLQIGAGRERLASLPRARHSLLAQIFGKFAPSRQRARKSTHERHELGKPRFETGREIMRLSCVDLDGLY